MGDYYHHWHCLPLLFLAGFRAAKKVDLSFRGVLLKAPLRLAYLALIIIAILQPNFGTQKKEMKIISKDVVLAMDLSTSMGARDLLPDRLSKAKKEALKIIDELENDRIALWVFGKEPYLHCPFTFDKEILSTYVQALNEKNILLNSKGTDFNALLEALPTAFPEQEKGMQDNKVKLVVVFSDGGEDIFVSSSALSALRNQNIRLFTVGVGGKIAAKVYYNGSPFKGEDGVITSKLNTKPLRFIARKTQGKYFEINQQNKSVDALLNDLKNVKGNVESQKEALLAANKYYYFLYLALFLMALDFLINIKNLR